ncbi:MAG: SlyX family protein [Desulfobacteraceae bacterium]|nr:SlyX family protein [Desulfobacteraceae bacterium]
MSEERFIEIETKLAYQDKTIKELNDVICEQQKEIDKLNTVCQKLTNLIKQHAQMAEGIDAPANEKPPHY